MNTEILGVVVQIALMVILAYPLGKYIAKVYRGEKTWSDFMAPIERVIYKVCGIDPNEESIVDFECFLVFLGNGTLGFTRMVALKSGRQRTADSGSGIQYLYQFYGEL